MSTVDINKKPLAGRIAGKGLCSWRASGPFLLESIRPAKGNDVPCIRAGEKVQPFPQQAPGLPHLAFVAVALVDPFHFVFLCVVQAAFRDFRQDARRSRIPDWYNFESFPACLRPCDRVSPALPAASNVTHVPSEPVCRK